MDTLKENQNFAGMLGIYLVGRLHVPDEIKEELSNSEFKNVNVLNFLNSLTSDNRAEIVAALKGLKFASTDFSKLFNLEDKVNRGLSLMIPFLKNPSGTFADVLKC